MKKITALLLVIFMMLAIVLTACGENEVPIGSESASESGNTNTDASESTALPSQNDDTQTDGTQADGTQTDVEQTTGGEQPGTVTPGGEKQPEDAPEPINGDEYTKVFADPSILNLFTDILADVSKMFEKTIDLSEGKAYEISYNSSVPTFVWDFESDTITETISDTSFVLDIDLTDRDVLLSYQVKNGEDAYSDLTLYNAHSEKLGDVFVISAPEVLGKNLVLDTNSMMRLLSKLLSIASMYLDSVFGDEENVPMRSGLLGSTDDTEGGISIPYVDIDEEGNVTVDPALFELVTSLLKIVSDKSIREGLGNFASFTANDMFKLLLPKDDSLQKVEYATAAGEIVEAELAEISVNGFLGKMMILALANRIEGSNFSEAYGKIVEYLPDDISAYLPDSATLVSLLRTIAEEMTFGDVISVRRYIVDGVSIADEITISDAILTAIEEAMISEEEYYDDDDDYSEDYADDDDGEIVIYGYDDDDDDGEGWDDFEWPSRVSGVLKLEYCNGNGMFSYTTNYDDGESYVSSMFAFGKSGDGAYYLNDLADTYYLRGTEFKADENGFTVIKTEDCTDEEYPSSYTDTFTFGIETQNGNDVAFNIMKKHEYRMVSEEWNDATSSYEKGEISGEDVKTYRICIKEIPTFDTTLPSEVEENRYDISDMTGLVEIYSDLLNSKYGFLIQALTAKLFGGDSDEEW